MPDTASVPLAIMWKRKSSNSHDFRYAINPILPTKCRAMPMTPLDATSASLPFAEFAFWGGTRLSRPQTDQMVTPLSFSSLGSRCIGAFAPFADSREKAVVELPIRANLRTLHSTSDEIGFRIFLPKPLQHRKQNRRKRDVACRRAAFGCGDHDLGPSRAIELLSIDALDCLAKRTGASSSTMTRSGSSTSRYAPTIGR